MKQKLISIFVAIATFFVGVIGTLLVFHYVPFKKEIVNTTETKECFEFKETNSLKESIQKVYDAVVYVISYRNGRVYSGGSGFVYKKDEKHGYIITNHHVIDGATEVKIKNNAGETVEATVLGSDEYADIAVLSIDAKSVMQVAEMGVSTDLEIGDTLFTVGTPVGEEYMGTVTRGILSGKDRAISVHLNNGGSFIMEVIQTDASINPGNSGGPLVDINGKVIGVNSLKLVEDEIEGMGFAIPIEYVMTCVDRLEKGEKIVRPLFGAELLDPDNTYALYYKNIKIDSDITEGVVIVSTVDKKPAATAGLQKGDVVVEMDGIKVKNMAHFRFLLYKYEVGAKVQVKYIRDGKEKSTTVTLNAGVEDN